MRYISTKFRKVADDFLFKFPAGCSKLTALAMARQGRLPEVELTKSVREPTFGLELRLGAGNPTCSNQAFLPC